MANTTPRPWSILQALQARVQTITVAGGYRTNAGTDVRLERTSDVPTAPRVTLYSGGSVRPDDSRVPGEREFTLIVEAVVPTSLTNAHQMAVAIAEDIEDALDGYVQMQGALPLQFIESLYLDTPEGLPVMVAQLMFRTRFRR